MARFTFPVLLLAFLNTYPAGTALGAEQRPNRPEIRVVTVLAVVDWYFAETYPDWNERIWNWFSVASKTFQRQAPIQFDLIKVKPVKMPRDLRHDPAPKDLYKEVDGIDDPDAEIVVGFTVANLICNDMDHPPQGEQRRLVVRGQGTLFGRSLVVRSVTTPKLCPDADHPGEFWSAESKDRPGQTLIHELGHPFGLMDVETAGSFMNGGDNSGFDLDRSNAALLLAMKDFDFRCGISEYTPGELTDRIAALMEKDSLVPGFATDFLTNLANRYREVKNETAAQELFALARDYEPRPVMNTRNPY
ncbi:MAG: hypothetical protein V1798_01480 [Pseudomonadota bacterium]